MDNYVQIFKRAFFDQSSRAFGETYVQNLLYKILGEQKFRGANGIKSNLFDAQRGELRGEYKAVRVVFENEGGDNMYEKITNFTHLSTRIGKIQDIKDGKIISNFQNIKLHDDGGFDFDYLVYVLVDDFGFHIFEVSGDDMEKFVKDGLFQNWCAKHGSKETGKNGQFPVKKENIEWHFSHNHKKDVSWEELVELAKTIKL